jgi:HSP20 family protein
MNITKYNKNNGLNLFEDFANEFFGGFPIYKEKTASTNVIESEKDYNVEIAIPGFKKEEIKIDVNDDVLTITGSYENSKNETTANFTKKEFSKKSFTRTFQIPEDVDGDKISAKVEDGILNIKLDKKTPQIEEKKTKQIEIK